MSLIKLGWNNFFEEKFQIYKKSLLIPSRIIRDNKISYIVSKKIGEEFNAILSKKLLHNLETSSSLPAVGDWVAIDYDSNDIPIIKKILPRKTYLSRKHPGSTTKEQILASNIDIVFLVTDFNIDFNLRRLERTIIMIKNSLCKPVVVINKSDLFTKKEINKKKKKIMTIFPEIDIIISSIKNEESLRKLKSYFKVGISASFIGSSGVGKSSLVNSLLKKPYQIEGELNKVTKKGNHTTTFRELIAIPQGGVIIDTPGIREIQLYADDITIEDQFPDINLISKKCFFNNCKHKKDKGCAIKESLSNGSLSKKRYLNYLKLKNEIEKMKFKIKKRKEIMNRIKKKNTKIQSRNLEDRVEYEIEISPDPNSIEMYEN